MNSFDTTDTVFVAVLLILLAIQMFYHWFFYARLAFYKEKKEEKPPAALPVSVVIAARNEYYNLKRNLPAILEQDYPQFEVVVVNHASEDETKDLLKEFSGRYKNLKTVNIDRDLNFFKGKKFPLSIGIKSAHYETLLLTDADCRPSSKLWIRKMAAAYGNDNTEIVLGYGPYKKEKTFLNLLIRYDSFQVALTYLSFALAGIPYMGVGRNLSYKKSLFIKNKGFISHYNISSGDDDLFISEVATKQNTSVEISKESAVFSEPKKTFGQWIKQKRRHMTTGKKYKFHIKLLLGILSLSQWLFYLTVILMLIFNIQIVLALTVFALRLISQTVIFKFAGDKLQENHIFVYLLFLEPLFLFLTPIFTLQGIFGKNGQWR